MTPDTHRELLSELDSLQQRLSEIRRKLVGEIDREQLPSGAFPLLVCRVGEERVAFLQQCVVEVVMMAKLTPMPESPEWVAGLLNCRGQTIPVIDVLARLTRAAHRPSLSDVVVICSVAGRRFGLIVQEILSVDTVPPRSVQPPSPETEHAPYLLGVIQLAQQMILLFSVAALLDVASSSGANG